jgi:phosphate:Na+ symporter
VGESILRRSNGGPDNARAGQLCAEAMRSAGFVAGEVAAPHYIVQSVGAAPALLDAASNPATVSTAEALVQLERRPIELEELQRNCRSETLGAVANGTPSADAAMVRVDTLRSLEALAYHAWRSAAHLVGRGEIASRSGLHRRYGLS